MAQHERHNGDRATEEHQSHDGANDELSHGASVMLQKEWISGNIFIRPNCLDRPGAKCEGHKHNFDHTTIFYVGKHLVRATGPEGQRVERVFEAPAHALIRKDWVHEITSLQPTREEAIAALKDLTKEQLLERLVEQATQPATFWCVYSHRDPQARVTQVYTGWDEANG